MTWKDRLLKLAALVLTISFTCVWFSLVFFPERNDPLVFFLFLSTVSGGLLGLDKLFAGESSGRGRRGIGSGTDRYLDDDRLMELDGHESRLADLEARLEFAERLLANQEREMLSPPSTGGDRSFDTESRPAHRHPQRTPRP